MQLSPQTIRKKCYEHNLITPFKEHYQHKESGLSGGLSHAGYDIHLRGVAPAGKPELRLFSGAIDTVSNAYGQPRKWIIPPGTGILGVTDEHFNLPRDICMMYYNKSTMARLFIQAAATLGEPGWRGHLTLEILNITDVPATLILGQPIGQVIFNQLDFPSESAYNGKYQDQKAEPVQGLRFDEVVN